MKLGRLRPSTRPRVRLASHLCSELISPPSSCDYSVQAMPALLELYDNDKLGDCVVAGAYHVLGVATGNARMGIPYIATEEQILADYSAIGGYVPGDAGTDRGCNEADAITYWSTTGFADGSKLAGSAGVDGSNVLECKQALYLFETLYLGIELPDEWITPFPSAPGFVWDVAGDPNPENGHCIMACGYDATGLIICSWGMLGKLTWEALAKYAVPSAGGECYALLTPDMLDSGQLVAPNGVAWDELEADLANV